MHMLYWKYVLHLKASSYSMYLVEVVKSLVQVGEHACGRFIGDLDGGLQDPLRDDVRFWNGCWLSRHVHSVRVVASFAVLLQGLLQLGEPLGHQVDVLQEKIIE